MNTLEQIYENMVLNNPILLEGNNQQLNTMYDFGGADYVYIPDDDNINHIIVVDKNPNMMNENEDDIKVEHIKKNIFTPIDLPIKNVKFINISKVLRYAKNFKEVEIALRNADKHLAPGGVLQIFEDVQED